MPTRYRTSWFVVLLLLITISLCGCGGGSGGTSAGASDSISFPSTSGVITIGANAPASGAVNPVATGNTGTPAGGPAVAPVTPVTPVTAPTVTRVQLNFVLSRAVPTYIGSYEFTGMDGTGQVLYGPETRPKQATIVLENVPLEVTLLRIRFHEGTTLHGEANVAVSLSSESTFVIDDPDFTVFAQPTEVTVTPGSDSLFPGNSVQLVAVQHFTDSSLIDISNSGATWESSDSSVARVSSTGLVEALQPGSATIRALGQGTPGSSTITVRNNDVTALQTTPQSLTLVERTSRQLQVNATYADGTNSVVTTDPNTSYLSRNPGIASVSNSGLITGNSPGSTTLEIQFGGQLSSVTVTVDAATLVSIQVTLQQNSVTVGQATQASVTGTFDNLTTGDVTGSATLSSGSTSVATTSGTTINGVGVGTSVITARIGALSDTASLQVTALPASPGLTRLNSIRTLGGLPPVTENSTWSSEAVLHSTYMVKNDFIGHSEDPGNPFYTVEGNRAAGNSNLSITSVLSSTIQDGIDGLMEAPFHGVGFIDPQLLSSGFGFYCENIGTFKCGTTVNVLQGLGSAPAGTTYPITWPANGQIMPYTAYGGGENPDPLTGLPGFTVPTGAPIYVQFGPGNATVNVTSVTLRNNTTSQPVTVGYFDENTYTNPSSSSQSLGRNVLGARDCLVIMASSPLTRGHNYTCNVTNNGTVTSWSFTVSNFTTRQFTEPAIEIIR